MDPEIFPITSASSKTFWLLALIGITVFCLLILMAILTWSSQNMHCSLSAEGLKLSGGFYGRFVPMNLLDVKRASMTDLRVDPGSQPKTRTQGLGLPGQTHGWFKLRNGQRALLFVTDPSRVVKLPTRDGYILMLSISNGEHFIRRLRNAAAAGA